MNFNKLLVLLLLFIANSYLLSAQTSTHAVVAGETLYHISKTYGITVDELVKANPGITAETLKAGSTLNIPARKGNLVVQSVATPQKQTNMAAAILLPLSAQGIEGNRSVEFYRGFIMAAEELSNRGFQINLFGYDESAADFSMNKTLEKIRENQVQFIVGPVYPSNFSAVAAFARANQIRMVVPFYSKAEQVNTNPYVYVVNTPEKFEFEFEADLFMKTFKNVHVAFMHVEGSNEQNFTQYLRKRLQAKGYSIGEFSNDAPLEQMKSALNNSRETVIIPDGSTQSGMAKALAKVEGFKKYYPEYNIKLIGYQEWLEYTEKYQSRLHSADTYIFTKSFYNSYDPKIAKFESAYRQKFGTSLMQNVTPRMGLLGYDIAMHFFEGTGKYGKDFSTQSSGAKMLQSNLLFERTEQDGGLVNNSLFFIHFKQDNTIDKLSASHK